MITLVARALLRPELSHDPNLSAEVRKAMFPILMCSAAASGYLEEVESLVKSGVRFPLLFFLVGNISL